MKKETYRITWNHGGKTVTKTYAKGASFADCAADFQPYYDEPILLAVNRENHSSTELFRPITEDGEMDFLTYRDKEGQLAYMRTAILLMLKAIYRIAPHGSLQRVTVEFAIGAGYYIVPRGSFVMDEKVLEKVTAQMQKWIDADMPIRKFTISTDDAVSEFYRHGMEDKAKLFQYRRISSVNVYDLDGFRDYFYGPMCARTGYIRTFLLKKYGDGFILLLPKRDNPHMLPDFSPSGKLFAVQKESFQWAERIGIENIGDLNEAICRGEANNLILMQEAFFEKKIGEIAQRISKKDKKIILLAGPSSSGKTSTAHRLSLQLRAYGIIPHTISADDYFRDFKDRELTPEGKPDFESLRAVDTEQFNQDMLKLLAGEEVILPKYNFITGLREYRKNPLKLGEEDVLIIEGIHCLNEAFSERLPRESKYKVYVSALTQLNIDEHNRIPTTDCRLLRRLVRDSRTRGYSAENTLIRWPEVRAGEEENIFPFQNEADVTFNTAMIYELAVIKLFAEPLLFSVPAGSPVYGEAKRLLKFLDYVLPVSPEIIPKTSIVREFIGGSCLDVG